MFSNQTPNYGLPQYKQNDTLNVLSDFNGAMETIDSTMKSNELAAASAQSKADGADTKANNNATAITDLQTAQNADRTDINTLTRTVNTINSLIGNGEPTTTDKTIIGAINEINDIVISDKFRLAETVEMGKVIADGVKTFSQLITDLKAAVLATLKADYNAKARFSNVTVFSPVLNFIRDENAPSLYRPTSAFNSTFVDVNLFNGDVVITQLNFGNSTLVHNVAGTYTDISSDVPASGTEITVYGIRYVQD